MAGSTFNLIDRAWIPVVTSAGENKELSIKEVFKQARGITSIAGDLPVQQFALTRLLIAVLYGMFDVTDPDFINDTWKVLWESGPKNEQIWDAFEEYFSRVHARFDIFDEQQPFYQVAGLHTAKGDISGLEKLIMDVPNGDPFFTTRIGEGLDSIDAGEAARWLVTDQAFDSSGIKSGAVGDPRVKSGRGYPIGTAWAGNIGGLLIEAEDLWETLLLNFVGEGVLTQGDGDAEWEDDKPIWDREVQTERTVPMMNQPKEYTGSTNYFHGPATLMTWQSRRMLLQHDGERVTGVLICNGDRLKPQNAQCYEMMSAWRRSVPQEKALKIPRVYMPRKHDPTKSLWQGLPQLTSATEDVARSNGEDATSLRPYSLRWMALLSAEGALPQGIPVRLHAFGVEYGSNESVIAATVDDTLDLDVTVLTSRDASIGQAIGRAVNMADSGVKLLQRCVAEICYAQGTDTAKSANDISECKRVGDTAYVALDAEFRHWIKTVHGVEHLAKDMSDWCQTAQYTLRSVEQQYMGTLSTRAVVGRSSSSEEQHYSAADADRHFVNGLRKIFGTQGKES